jgi:hypothetical protein
VNKQWHAAHLLGRGATRNERIAWHRLHQQHCACRPIPRSLIAAEPAPQAPKARVQTPKPGPREAKPPAEAEFSKLKARFPRDAQASTGGKGFGRTALKVDGKIFAMLSSKQEFVVKLPRERVAELVSVGHGRYFDAGKGKRMKEWLVVDAAPARWFSLAREARLFVGAK